MEIPNYFVKDGDTLKLYPSKLMLAIVTGLSFAILSVLLVVPHNTTSMIAYVVLDIMGTLFFSILTFGFAREFWHKEPIVTITPTSLTIRGIPFWAPETINWSEIDDIAIVKNRKNSFLFIYEKPGSSEGSLLRERLGTLSDNLNRKQHYINTMFLPRLAHEGLFSFLTIYHLGNRTQQKTFKNIKLVIFDCDGVLVDSETLSYETYTKVFAQENFDLSPDELLDRLSGLSLPDMIAMLEKTEGRSFSSDILDKIDKAIRESFSRSLKPVSGTSELLEKLTAHGIKICVVSNGFRGRIDHALTVTGLKKYFPDNHIFDVSQVKNGKPAPDLLLYAAKQMGANPMDTVVVDDSVTGIRAAQAARMAVIGFLGGSHAAAEGYQTRINRAQADTIAYSMDEISDFFIAFA